MRRIAAFLFLGTMILSPAAARAGWDEIGAGTLIGAGLGALTGNQIGHGTGKIAATAVGAFTGAVIGNKALDEPYYDRHRRHSSGGYYGGAAYYQPQPVYYAPNYVAPSAPPPAMVIAQPYYDEEVYVVQPAVAEETPVYQTVAQQEPYCREYTQRVTIGNQVQESYGTACQQPDGSWKIVK